MPRKVEVPMITIRTYHVTEPVGVFDKAKADFWTRRNDLRKAGIPHRANILTGEIIEGVL